MLRPHCLLLAFALASAAAPDWAPWPTERWAESAPEAQGLDPTLLQQADGYIQNQCPTRHTFLVIRNGYVVFERYYRGKSADSINNIASICKNVISALTGIAIDKGLIQGTNQPMLDFYPEYASLFEDPRKREIRIKHMLSMTAGFEPAGSGASWEVSYDWFRWILSRSMVNDPGEAWDYNTGLTHLLSGILTKVSGQSTAAFAEQNLFGPLGIREYRWDRDPRGYYAGGYRLSLKARDLAKLAYLYLRNGRWEDRQVVSTAWVEDSTAIRFDNEPVNYGGPWGYSMNVVGDYGYAWWIRWWRGYRVFFGAGSCGQDLFVVPALRLVVVTMASTDTDSAEIGDQGFRLLWKYVLPAIKMQPPALSDNGAVHGASLAAPIVAGGFATLLGTNLTNRVSTWDDAMPDGKTFPTSLAGVTVTIAGRPCPISYADPWQLNVLVPPDTPEGDAEIEVTNPEGTATMTGVQIRAIAPGFFTVARTDGGKSVPAAVSAAEAVLIAPRRSVPGVESRPARPGEAVALFATGLGPTAEFNSLKEALGKPLAIADPQSVRISIDGEPVQVLGAWMTFAGLYQVNILVPEAALTGDLPLVMEVAGVPAQKNLVLTVSR